MNTPPTAPNPGDNVHSPLPSGEGIVRLEPKQHHPVEPGGFWRRFAAVTVDGLILSFALTPLTLVLGLAIGMGAVLGDPDTGSGTEHGLVLGFYILYYLVYLTGMFLYFGWFYKNKGATPGKMIFQLKVHHVDSGRYIGYWHAFGRESVGKMISAIVLGLGYLMVVIHPHKRALHDVVFRTRVVRSA